MAAKAKNRKAKKKIGKKAMKRTRGGINGALAAEELKGRKPKSNFAAEEGWPY